MARRIPHRGLARTGQDPGASRLPLRLDLGHRRAKAHGIAGTVANRPVGQEQRDRGTVRLAEAAHEGLELALALELLLDGSPRRLLHDDDLPDLAPHDLLRAIPEDLELLRIDAHDPHLGVDLVHADPGWRLLEGALEAQRTLTLRPFELIE